MIRLLREIKIELYTSVLLQCHLPVLLFHRWYMRWFLSVRLNSNHCHLSGKCLLHRVIRSSYTSNDVYIGIFDVKIRCDIVGRSRGRFRFVVEDISRSRSSRPLFYEWMDLKETRHDRRRMTKVAARCQNTRSFSSRASCGDRAVPRYRPLKGILFPSAVRALIRAQTTQAGRESTRVKTVQFTRGHRGTRRSIASVHRQCAVSFGFFPTFASKRSAVERYTSQW